MFSRLVLCCAVLALLPSTGSAAFYKHVDANGVTTYSNLAPAAPGQVVQPVSRPAASAQAEPGRYVEVRDDLYGAMDFDPQQAQLNKGATQTIEVDDEPTLAETAMVNQILRELLEQSLHAPPPSATLPAPLEPAVYPWPWQGGPFPISQGANGNYSHNTPQGRYALDIAMPPGTPVIAARAGRVMTVHDGQSGRAGSPSGNHVRLLHDDGSMSVYLHLQKDSISVAEGQRVALGAPLGRSGNTGNSTGPHLHFAVQRQVGARFESIPFRFEQPLSPLPNFALSGE
ncbi:MAG: M23 family metallopeptidase [Pseudomonas sp.]|uniref:peptidoglycan DD-metalloendopeptidase family protein n=1 Tax=Pseudomonas sp. TaxID=306 RepID=UPI003396D301